MIFQRIILILGFLFLLLFGLEFFDVFDKLYVFYIPIFIAIVVLFIFKDNLKYWHAKKFKLTLPKKEAEILAKDWYLFNELLPSQYEDFFHRVHLKILGNDFKTMGEWVFPEQAKLFLSATAVYVENYRKLTLPDTIYVLYKHPFPSPKNKDLHIVEWDKEDHTAILSFPHFRHGIEAPKFYFDIGLFLHLEIAGISKIVEQRLELNHFDVTPDQIQQYLGISHLDWDIVLKTLEISHQIERT